MYTPLHPTFILLNWGLQGFIFFLLNFALKHRLWVLIRTCTHDLCHAQKYHNFSSENYRFYIREILQNIAWVCYRNVCEIQHYISFRFFPDHKVRPNLFKIKEGFAHPHFKR